MSYGHTSSNEPSQSSLLLVSSWFAKGTTSGSLGEGMGRVLDSLVSSDHTSLEQWVAESLGGVLVWVLRPGGRMVGSEQDQARLGTG